VLGLQSPPGGATGAPLAIGLRLLHDGKVKDHGVFAPEQVIDPDDFFNEPAPLCTIPLKLGNEREIFIIM